MNEKNSHDNTSQFHRKLTEAEVRGLLVMQWTALDYALVWASTMMLRKRKPTADEIRSLSCFMAQARDAVTDLSKGHVTDGHQYDSFAEFLAFVSNKLREKI